MTIKYLAAMVLAGAAASALATPTYYTDKTAFLAAAGRTSFESFEQPILTGSAFANYPFVSAYTDTPFFSFDINATDGAHAVTLYNYFTPEYVLFQFGRPITAFGIDVVDLGDLAPASLIADTNGDTGSVYTDHLVGVRNEVLFAGVIDPAGFESVALTDTSGGDLVSYDSLYTARNFAGGVPEPTSWAMLIAGFGLVGAIARRRGPSAVAA